MAKRPRYDRTARMLRISHLLYQYPRGLTAERLAEFCEVSKRTIYRDIAAIQDTDVAISQDRGRYLLDFGVFLPPLKLNLMEATALFLAARLVSRHTNDRDPNIESAFIKLGTALPRPVAQHVSDTVAVMKTKPENSQYSKVFNILARAWATGKRVCIKYPHVEGNRRIVEDRLVEPFFLEPSQIGHSCYLIAYCHHAQGLRTFKLERIQGAELTDQDYEIPSDFDANKYLRPSWGVVADEEVEVRLRFTPAVAARVQESRWHPSQRMEILPDGSVDFTVKVAGTMEITPWILGWGLDAEVLAPEDLRCKFARWTAAMAARYACHGDGTIAQGRTTLPDAG